MIKIVKTGTKRITECPNCGAILKYDHTEDAKNVRSLPLPYDLIGEITCPQCNCEFSVRFERYYL